MLEAARAKPRAFVEEKRRHQRVKVNVLGRYMAQSRQEFPCQIVNMSPGGAALIAPTAPIVGERIIIYVDHVGRVEGKVARHFPGGFAMEIHATSRKRDKMAAQLTWLANRHGLDLPEDRRHDRLLPRNPNTHIVLTDGSMYRCRVLDMSLSGAAVATEARLAIGQSVMLGRLRGRVVRQFETGVAIEFANLQSQESLETNLRLDGR
jgi:hypothetical protein